MIEQAMELPVDVGEDELPSPQRRRVLIVDDEEGIRSLFQMIIAHDLPNVCLDLASNGAEAIGRFCEGPYDVVIMDLHMPVMDGLSAFAGIQQYCQDRGQLMPAVIFCTGFAPPRGVRDIVNGSKRHSLLSKPVKSEVLINALRGRL